jgi:two-component system sensor histidine kinase MprB
VSLRTKLAVWFGVLAGVAAITMGWFSYSTTSDRLDAEVRRSLEQTVAEVVPTRLERDEELGLPPDDAWPTFPRPRFEAERRFGISGQYISTKGDQLRTFGGADLPVSDAELATVRSEERGEQSFRDVEIDGDPYRMLTVAFGDGSTGFQTARNLSENQRLLNDLLVDIAVATAVVVVVAAGVGWIVARQVTRRLVRLTGAAEEVASTGRLDVAVPVAGTDEAGRLGIAFNEMLTALATSKDDQHRLVQDAGHELRTPLTSLRTNIEVLGRHELAPDVRREVLSDLDGEARELSGLVNELVELATEQRADEPAQPVVLGPLVARVVERMERRTQHQIVLTADASVVSGRPQLLERAVGNLVENAAKFDAAGSAPIEVTVAAGRIEVADRGPGIDPDDLPHVFDRFFRATAARAQPGSGLGLAIVADVAGRHGGSVFAANRPGGGAVIGMQLPLVTN